MNRPNIIPGPWGHCYTSAAKAREKHPGYDGGGASGFIYDEAGVKNSYTRKIIAFLPHHRDPKEDEARGANAQAIAALPDLLAAFETLLPLAQAHFPQGADHDGLTNCAAIAAARAALIKAGYQF